MKYPALTCLREDVGKAVWKKFLSGQLWVCDHFSPSSGKPRLSIEIWDLSQTALNPFCTAINEVHYQAAIWHRAKTLMRSIRLIVFAKHLQPLETTITIKNKAIPCIISPPCLGLIFNTSCVLTILDIPVSPGICFGLFSRTIKTLWLLSV